MWWRIEFSYSKLSPTDQETVKAAGHGYAPVFHGFDGNNETTEMGVADMLINDLNRWHQFKGRDLNAHMPTRTCTDACWRH